MGTQYLVDTNAIIEFLGGVLNQEALQWMELALGKEQLAISVINKMELLSFQTSLDEMIVLESFVQSIKVLPLTESVANKTIQLRREFRIKLPDAIIAACCLEEGLTLITRNVRDFRQIPELKQVNLWKGLPLN